MSLFRQVLALQSLCKQLELMHSEKMRPVADCPWLVPAYTSCTQGFSFVYDPAQPGVTGREGWLKTKHCVMYTGLSALFKFVSK